MDTFNTSAGDGRVSAGQDTPWSVVRAADPGWVATYTGVAAQTKSLYNTSSYYDIFRGFLPFDTSTLPAEATITDATLTLYADGNKWDAEGDAYSYVVVVSSTQASATVLVVEDFAKVGSTALTNTITITNWNATTGQPNVFTFTDPDNQITKAGLTKLALREGHDFANQAPDAQNDDGTGVGFCTLENTEEAYRPLLSVTYTLPGEPEVNIKYDSTNVADGGTYDYGEKFIGTNNDVTFTIENLGDADLTLGGSPIIVLGGTNPDQFSVQLQPTTPIAESESTTFTIRFSPTSAGAKSTTIAIENNDVDENPYNITFTGTGMETEPEIDIKYNSTGIADGGTYDYGSKNLETNTDQVFTIENSGGVDLTLSGSPIITITGTNADQFSVQAQPTSPIVPSGDTTFTIRFSPKIAGEKTASIAIANNDTDENPYNITLTGTGIGTSVGFGINLDLDLRL